MWLYWGFFFSQLSLNMAKVFGSICCWTQKLVEVLAIEVVMPSPVGSAMRQCAMHPSFKRDFWELIWWHSVDMTRPAELLTSNLVHDSVWAVEEFTEVFNGYLVDGGYSCFVVEIFCFKSGDSTLVISCNWPTFTCVHSNGDNETVRVEPSVILIVIYFSKLMISTYIKLLCLFS